MPRFVILRHETPAGAERPSHWDLMLEAGAGLATWALSELPRAGVWVAAEPLADHRVAYLDYEGPISGDRGTVARWDAGQYEVEMRTACAWRIRVRGDRLRGVLDIRADGKTPGRWSVCLSPRDDHQ